MIETGFTPEILFIFSPLAIGIKIDTMPGDLIFIGNGMGQGIALSDLGFTITAAATATLNNNGSTFYYLAHGG